VSELTRKPLDGFAVGLMVLLCASWGLQQVAIKVTVPHIGPIMQAAVRSCLAGLLVLIFALVRQTPLLARDATWRPGLLAGVLFGIEFLCIFIGLNYTTASRMGVFLYVAPVATALGLHWFVPGERLRAGQWIGVILAFSGLLVAFSDGLVQGGSGQASTLRGDLLGIMAGILWASTTVIVRATTLSSAPPSKTLLYQLGVSGVLLMAVAFVTGQATTMHLTALSVTSLLYQAVIIAFASYLVWFWMLRRYLASRLSVFSFLTPLFSVAFGVMLLQESVSMQFAVGAVLILAGIVLVNRRR
jgi:drug/metabolite transporter (DMT)-like permease